ncbi:restriction endonuclease subunit S [Vibrio vulnificus]|nr:restriction endonuclease subunit S [Vibrio vulnificus]ELN6896798.1 restriction endonuclease subunit S [Vibrio vulnificus]
MSWSNVALSTLVDIKGGGTPSKANPEYWNGSIPWASVKDFKSSDLNGASDYITQEGIDNSATSLIPRGNLIVPTRMALGKIAINSVDIAINQDLKALIIKDESVVDTEYLFRCIQSKSEEIVRQGKGATVKGITVDVLKNLQIPLPPLETQKQIAAVLEKADQLRKDCKLLEQELNSLAQSVFIDMFGSKASGYSEWPLHRIEELAESKKGSMRTGPFGSDLKHSEFVDEGIAVIGIDNAVKNEFAWGERRFITPEKYEKLKRYRVYPQDLIITIMGTTGRIAVIPDDIPLSISTKHLAVITLDKDKVIPEFLATAIKTHPDLLHQIIDSNKGAIMDGLNLGLIKALSLRLPPLDLQLKYLAVLKVIRERIFESRSSHEQNNDLFNSLMQKAFKGELNL